MAWYDQSWLGAAQDWMGKNVVDPSTKYVGGTLAPAWDMLVNRPAEGAQTAWNNFVQNPTVDTKFGVPMPNAQGASEAYGRTVAAVTGQPYYNSMDEFIEQAPYMSAFTYNIVPGKYAKKWEPKVQKLKEATDAIEDLYPGMKSYSKEHKINLDKAEMFRKGIFNPTTKESSLFFGSPYAKQVKIALHEGGAHLGQTENPYLKGLAQLQAKDYLGYTPIEAPAEFGLSKKARKYATNYGMELQARTIEDVLTDSPYPRFTPGGERPGRTMHNWSDIYRDILSSDNPIGKAMKYYDDLKDKLSNEALKKRHEVLKKKKGLPDEFYVSPDITGPLQYNPEPTFHQFLKENPKYTKYDTGNFKAWERLELEKRLDAIKERAKKKK